MDPVKPGPKPPTHAERRPKKLRGDAARIMNLTRVAQEAVQNTERANARNATLTRVISTLVERSIGYTGGRAQGVRVSFREIAGAGELGMGIENEGTPDAAIMLAVAPRRRAPNETLLPGDRVLITSWARARGAEAPDLEGLAWPGVVDRADATRDELVVRLDAGDLVGAPPELAPSEDHPTGTVRLVVVRAAWVSRAIRSSPQFETQIPIEYEQEEDGRWIADIPSIPGTMAYGATKEEAHSNVVALLLSSSVPPASTRVDTSEESDGEANAEG